jgi:hypothetical protein
MAESGYAKPVLVSQPKEGPAGEPWVPPRLNEKGS